MMEEQVQVDPHTLLEVEEELALSVAMVVPMEETEDLELLLVSQDLQ